MPNSRPSVRKGRGALTSPAGRFETRYCETVTDGWERPGEEEALPPLATTVTPEAARGVITRNHSPDIPFAQSINPYRGCEHGCIYCLDGRTPILMADGRHRPLADIRAGDEIYGTVRHGGHRRYLKTRVLAHWSTIKPAYRVVLEDGTELVAGADHRFLTERGWKFVAPSAAPRPSLTIGNKLMGSGAFALAPAHDRDYQQGYLCGLIRVVGLPAYRCERAVRAQDEQYPIQLVPCDREALRRAQCYLQNREIAVPEPVYQAAAGTRHPVSVPRSRELAGVESIRAFIAWPGAPSHHWCAGFLAGIFDAAGSYSDGTLRISQADADIATWTGRCLRHFGFRFATESVRLAGRGPVTMLRLLGGLREHLRFFHSTDPAIRGKCEISGRAVKSGAKLRVVNIEALDVRRLYDITTGSGDFIANGVVSHNCYARPSHAYMNLSPGLDFETRLFYKQDAARLLERELRKPNYRPAPITLGANTDPYQPIERKFKVTRSILEVLQRFRHPVTIITKSTLITRDLDILTDMAGRNLASVMISVTTLRDELKRTLEPRAAGPYARLRALHALSLAGVPAGVLAAPVIPMVNDMELERILEAAASAGACCAGYVLLRLPYEVKDLFREWLQVHFPERAAHVLSLIRQMHGGKDYQSEFGLRMRGSGPYAELIARRFQLACRRLNLLHARRMRLSSAHFRPPPASGGQLALWPE